MSDELSTSVITDDRPAQVHPMAVVDPRAELAHGVVIGPGAVIGPEVSIGANTWIGPHVVLDGLLRIGAHNRIYPGACLGQEPQDLKYKGAPTEVVIGDHNTIRECVTINRATDEGEQTRIGDNNLLMAYCHLGHNCLLGNNIVMSNGIQVAGHVLIEDRAVIGGCLGIHQFVHIGGMAMVGGMTRVDRDVPPYCLVEGHPGRVRGLNRVGLRRQGLHRLEGGQEFKQLQEVWSLLYRSDHVIADGLNLARQQALLPAANHLCTFLEGSLSTGRRGPMPPPLESLMVRLLISTGEVSGDLQGSLLIQALWRVAKRRGLDLEVLALGGERMQAAGAELLADTSPMGAIGLWEALPLVLPTIRLQARVDRVLKERPPDGVVLIDYMGANVRLGHSLRDRLPDVPITYYIAPQEWAWRIGEGGTKSLLQFTDRILAIFPEEAEFYAGRGADVTWVGHPLLDMVPVSPDRQAARRALGLPSEGALLLLMPASRPQELRYLMPELVQAAATLQARDPSLHVIVPAGLERFEEPLQKALDQAGVRGTVIPADQADAMKPHLFAAADLALGKSGTVNLELALQGVPQVVGYRVSRVTAWVARRILRFHVDHISPVNLLLKERLVPELLQEDFNADQLVALAIPLLDNQADRQRVLDGYQRLRDTLGEPGVTDRAAESIFDQIQQPS